MPTPVWTLVSWPKVWCPAESHSRLATQFRHLSTSLTDGHADEGAVRGQVLFGFEFQQKMFGVAWDWVAIGGRFVAMADPMSIVSNVYFVTDDGVTLDDSARIVQLNNLIHRLSWQRPVRGTLPRREAPRRMPRGRAAPGGLSLASAA